MVDEEIQPDRIRNIGWNKCENDHSQYIPVNKFKLSDLPLSWQNKKTFERIQHLAYLTVKVTTNYVSPDRPETDPIFRHRGQKIVRTGSGMVFSVFKWKKSSCALSCWTPHKTPSRQAIVLITTANHLVFDDKEARETVAELFYDDEENKQNIVRLHGDRLFESDMDMDTCILGCTVHKQKVAQSLSKVLKKLSKEKIDQRISRDFGVQVSHPHGASKQIRLTVEEDYFPVQVMGDFAVFSLVYAGPVSNQTSEISGIDINVTFPDGTARVCRVSLLGHSLKENKQWLLYDGGIGIPHEQLKMVWKQLDDNPIVLDETKPLEDYVDLLTGPGELEIKYITEPVALDYQPQLVANVHPHQPAPAQQMVTTAVVHAAEN